MICERTGKHKHEKKLKAIRHLDGMRKRFSKKDKRKSGIKNVYQCRYCGYWHCGRKVTGK